MVLVYDTSRHRPSSIWEVNVKRNLFLWFPQRLRTENKNTIIKKEKKKRFSVFILLSQWMSKTRIMRKTVYTFAPCRSLGVISVFLRKDVIFQIKNGLKVKLKTADFHRDKTKSMKECRKTKYKLQAKDNKKTPL